MATFGKTTFNTARYAAARPTYPRQLYDFIYKYHESKLGAKWERAVDLGCGTGQATTELTPFRHIIGVDPSAKMIDQARASIASLQSQAQSDPDKKLLPGTKLEFVQSAAEDLKFLEDGSVDLLLAAQACHWFDWNKMWPEAKRVLRKGGSAAFWGYSEFRLSSHPRLTSLIHAYSQGSDPATSLGPHWEQPGRSIVDGHLMAVPEPWIVTGKEGEWEEFRRVFWVGSHHPSLPPPHLPILLRKRMSWSSLLDYLGSFSSLHTFKQKYPEDEKREEGGIERRFWGVLREGVREDLEKWAKEGKEGNGEKGGEGEGEGEEVDVEWPMALILVRRA